MLKYLPVWLLILLPLGVSAQQIIISGKVLNHERQPLELATVGVKGTAAGTQTNAEGNFSLAVQATEEIVVQERYLGFKEQEKMIAPQPGSNRITLEIILQPDPQQLTTVDIRGKKEDDTREQVSVTKLDPRLTKELPSAFGDFNKILVTLPGVSSNNELSSTYTVRGGNYDENLVYVNGIEVYRPFLISAAQQEGLSFVNPDLVGNIEFSSGGWQPKYGDKLSSVLDIRYKRPQKFSGSVTGSLTGGSLHLESASKNKRVSYLLGVRNKSGGYLLKGLQTKGEYRPNFSDAQAYVSFDLSRDMQQPGRTTLGVLASYAQNKYLVKPEDRTTTFGTQQAPLRLFVGFDGKELMEYKTFQTGLNLAHQVNQNFLSELVVSVVQSREREFRDLEAGYQLCDVDNNGSNASGDCQQVRGIGSQYDHARNTLLARILTAESRNSIRLNTRSQVLFGAKIGSESIEDYLSEYGFTDSADFVTPEYTLKSRLNLNSLRYNGYVQHTYELDSLKTLTYGVRLSYWDYNQEFTITPRVQYSFITRRNPNLSFKAAIGLYYQPPFYRELRNFEGRLNPQLKAQRSLHAIVGSDYLFKAWGRDFKLTTEAYYKKLTNVIPYDIDNVRLRYYAQNNTKAYAAGMDVRVNGEFIPGAESWLSLGLLTTKEDVQGDSISVFSGNQVTGKKEQGYIRRPSDQLVNIGVFFQDHLPNNPTLRMNLNLVYGSGLPFGPPRQPEFRNAFDGKSYKRVDIGFSKLIVMEGDVESKNKVSLESLWIGLEILNLINAQNRVSYTYVQDVSGITYAVPNYLTGRRVNLRLVARF